MQSIESITGVGNAREADQVCNISVQLTDEKQSIEGRLIDMGHGSLELIWTGREWQTGRNKRLQSMLRSGDPALTLHRDRARQSAGSTAS